MSSNGKEKSLLKSKGFIGKVIGAAIVVAGSFGFVPPELAEIVGQELLGGGTALLSLILGIFVGKDLELETITKQLGMDRKAMKEYIRSNDLKKILTKVSMIFIAMSAIVILNGCGTAHKDFQPPEACITQNGTVMDSLILDHVKYPTETALVFKLTGLEVVKHSDRFTPEQYEGFVENLLKYV